MCIYFYVLEFSDSVAQKNKLYTCIMYILCVCVFKGTTEAPSECSSIKTRKHGQTNQTVVKTGASRSDQHLKYINAYCTVYIHITLCTLDEQGLKEIPHYVLFQR